MVFESLAHWYQRNFSHPQAVLLVVLLALATGIILFFGSMLAPVLAAVIIAYLLEGSVQALERRRIPRLFAVLVVFLGFLAALAFFVVGVLPILSHQVSGFVQDLPRMINEGRILLLQLPERYPQFVSAEQVDRVIQLARSGISNLGQNVVSVSLASITTVITWIVYLILGPVLVFFFLKDKRPILDWLGQFLPRDSQVLDRVWRDMDRQIGNYVRGKAYEILIVGGATYAAFTLLDLNYAPLLGVLVGLSVVVPYIGATVVTVPVVLAGYLQLGFSGEFAWVVVTYLIIQLIDGNVLVPILFSEATNLHPVAIILAVLVFGGLWGFWGVFFAIPLATLVNSLLIAWPRTQADEAAVANT